MNQNILDRIQQWLAEGKTPEWIAEELNFEDNTIDYYDVLNKANEIWEASKPKKKVEQESGSVEATSEPPLFTNVDSVDAGSYSPSPLTPETTPTPPQQAGEQPQTNQSLMLEGDSPFATFFGMNMGVGGMPIPSFETIVDNLNKSTDGTVAEKFVDDWIVGTGRAWKAGRLEGNVGTEAVGAAMGYDTYSELAEAMQRVDRLGLSKAAKEIEDKMNANPDMSFADKMALWFGENPSAGMEIMARSLGGMVSQMTEATGLGAGVAMGGATAGTAALASGAVGSGIGSIVPGAGTAIGGTIGATFGGVAGFIRGFQGGVSGMADASATIISIAREELQARGLDLNGDNLEKIFADDTVVSRMRHEAISRGITIAVFDTITGGLAGGAAKTVAKSSSKVLSSAAGKQAASTLTEMTGASIGEGVAQLVSTGELDPFEMVLEGVMEAPMGAVQTAVSAVPSYKINGEKVTRAEIESRLASGEYIGDLEVKRDDELSSRVSEARKNQAEASADVRQRVKEEAARMGVDLDEYGTKAAVTMAYKKVQDALADGNISAAEAAVTAAVKESKKKFRPNRLDIDSVDSETRAKILSRSTFGKAGNEAVGLRKRASKLRDQAKAAATSEQRTELENLARSLEAEADQKMESSMDRYRALSLNNPQVAQALQILDLELRSIQEQLADLNLEPDAKAALEETFREKLTQRAELENSIPETDVKMSPQTRSASVAERGQMAMSEFYSKEKQLKSELARLQEELATEIGDPDAVAKVQAEIDALAEERKAIGEALNEYEQAKRDFDVATDAVGTEGGADVNVNEAARAMQEAANKVAGMLGLDQQAVEDVVTDAPTAEWTAEAQAENHFTDPSDDGMMGSTFTLDGKNQVGQPRAAVSIFNERGVIIKGKMNAIELAAKLKEFKEANKDILNGNEDILSIGTYYDPESDQTFIDISAVVDREAAVKLGQEYNQESVFDLETFENIKTGGDGTVVEGLKPEADRVGDIRRILSEDKGKKKADTEMTNEDLDKLAEETRDQTEESAAEGTVRGEVPDAAVVTPRSKDGKAAWREGVAGLTAKEAGVLNKMTMFLDMLGINVALYEGADAALALDGGKHGATWGGLWTGGSRTIHINPAQIRENQLLEGTKKKKTFKETLQEETMHAVIGASIYKLYTNNADKANAWLGKLEKLAGKDLVERARAKADSYRLDNKPPAEVFEEQVIELLAGMASDTSNMKIIDRIRVYFNELFILTSAIRGKDVAISSADSTLKIITKFKLAIESPVTFDSGFTVDSIEGSDRASNLVSPAALKKGEDGNVTIKFTKPIYKNYGWGERKDVGSQTVEKTFSDQWHFINWWKKATSMGTDMEYRNFRTTDDKPIDVDRIKSYKSYTRSSNLLSPIKETASDINRMVSAAQSQGLISSPVASAIRRKTQPILRKFEQAERRGTEPSRLKNFPSFEAQIKGFRDHVEKLIQREAKAKGKTFRYGGDPDVRSSGILSQSAVDAGMSPMDLNRVADALEKLTGERPNSRVQAYEAMRKELMRRFPAVADRKNHFTHLIAAFIADPQLLSEKFPDANPLEFFTDFHKAASTRVEASINNGELSGTLEDNLAKLNIFAALTSAKNRATPNMEVAMQMLMDSEKYKTDNPVGITKEFIKRVANGKVKGVDAMTSKATSVVLSKLVSVIEGDLTKHNVPSASKQALADFIRDNGPFVMNDGNVNWRNLMTFFLSEFDGPYVKAMGYTNSQRIFGEKLGAWMLNVNSELFPNVSSNLGKLSDIVTVDTHVLNTGALVLGKFYDAELKAVGAVHRMSYIRKMFDSVRGEGLTQLEAETISIAANALQEPEGQRTKRQNHYINEAGRIIQRELQYAEQTVAFLEMEGDEKGARAVQRAIDSVVNPHVSESSVLKREISDYVKEITATINDTFGTSYSASQVGQLIFADRQTFDFRVFDKDGKLAEGRPYETYAQAVGQVSMEQNNATAESERASQLLLFPATQLKQDATDSPLFRKRKADEALMLRNGNMITAQAVREALSSDATSRRIIGKGNEIKEGQAVGVRLNLNVMKNTGLPVQTVHDKSASGEALNYAPAVMIKNPTLFVDQKARKKIVTFQENKFPMASVDGEFVSADLNAMNYDGVKAFFNPFKHNVFVDASGRPIKSAGEATIVGNTVYLRGDIEYYSFDDPILEMGRRETPAERAKRIKRGPKYLKALNRFKLMSERNGVEFASTAELEVVYDNMPIESKVALNESELASRMEEAQTRASSLLKIRQTAERSARKYPAVRKEILDNPNNYFQPQKLKDLKGDLNSKTDAELISIMSGQGLATLQQRNDDLGVLATAELISRAVARGDIDSVPHLVEQAAAIGTTAGRLLRHLRELKTSTPAGLVAIVESAVNKRGNKLTGDQKSRLETMAAEMYRLQAEHEDLVRRAIAGEDVEADLLSKTKEIKELERQLDTFSNAVVERGWGEIGTMLIQGNLLTPMSQITNVGANMINAMGKVAVDAIALPIEKLINAFGIDSPMNRGYSVSAYMWGLRKFGEGFVEALDTIITGQESDVTEWRIHRGFAPFRSIMSAMGKGDLPLGPDGKVSTSQRMKLAVQGTLGIPAETMFRFLSLGDTPFRRYVEGIELYHAGKNMGLEGDALVQFIKHPSKKAMEAAAREGRKLTFQERTTLSDVAQKATDFFEDMIAQGMSWVPGLDSKAFAKFMVRSNLPYLRTPANMLMETLIYVSPYVAGPSIMKKLSEGDARGASQDFGKLVVGTTVAQTAVTLIAQGLISDALDWQDDEKKNLAYDQFPPSSINVSGVKRWLAGGDPSHQPDDVFASYTKLGIIGAVIGATAKSVSKEDIKQRQADGFALHALQDVFGVGAFSGISYMMDQSFMQGMSTLINVFAAEDVDDFGDAVEAWTRTTFQAVSATVLPNTLSAMYRGTREYLPDTRVTKDMTRFERIATRMMYTIKDRTFGLSELPVRVDWKGNPIKQTPEGNSGLVYQLFDITKSRRGEADPVSNEIYRLYESTETITSAVGTPGYAAKRKLNVPNISAKHLRSLKAQGYDYPWMRDEAFMAERLYLNTTQMNRLMAVSGKERYNALEALIRSDKYAAMNDEQRVEAMNDINANYASAVEKDGTKFRPHSLLLFEIMQEIYDDERREEY